jgi:type I restriction enzyme S subunit
VSGATGLARNIAQGDVKNLIFAIPPVGEQCAIVEFLDREAGRIEELAGMVTAAITRLTEYRTALITAATTGKIDVRNVRIPQPTEQTAQPALKAISTHSGGG